MTLQVLKDLNIQSTFIYPNNDPGSELIIDEIESNRNNPKFRIYLNLEREIYLRILEHVDLIVGNSSSGLIEFPFFKLPVVSFLYSHK